MIKEIDSESLRARHLNGGATGVGGGASGGAGGGEAAGDAGLLLVDIRTPEEVAGGTIPNSIHIPMHLLPLRLTELPRDRDVVLYCRSGARSYHACQYLAQQGMTNAINLRGGIMAWARHGFEIGPPGASTQR